jgi:hypothetical protein
MLDIEVEVVRQEIDGLDASETVSTAIDASKASVGKGQRLSDSCNSLACCTRLRRPRLRGRSPGFAGPAEGPASPLTRSDMTGLLEPGVSSR